MGKLIISALLMGFISSGFAQQRVIWKIVWPAGNVLEAQYPSLGVCQDALRYAPEGSTCVAFQIK